MNLADLGGPRRPEGLRGRPRGPEIQSSSQSLPGPRGLAFFIPRLPCRRSDHQGFPVRIAQKTQPTLNSRNGGPSLPPLPPSTLPQQSPFAASSGGRGMRGGGYGDGGGGDWKSCRAKSRPSNRPKAASTLVNTFGRHFSIANRDPAIHHMHPVFGGSRPMSGLGRVIASGSGFWGSPAGNGASGAEPLGDIILSSLKCRRQTRSAI